MLDSSAMQPFDVVIVGGGLVGSSFALALREADLGVALVEPQPPRAPAADENWDSRIYALSPGNVEWLLALGVWSRLPAERLTPVETMRIFGDQARGRLEFSAYDAGRSELAWIVENGLVQRALWNAVQGSHEITLISPGHCADLMWERDFAVLTLADGRELRSRLIVGADGADSWVRDRAGISSTQDDYRQTGVVANFATAISHGGAAFQWFRADGVLALLPLPGNRVSMVWSAPEEWADELLASSSEALEREVEHASCGAVGSLELITPAAGFRLRRQRVERLVEPRAALIGDAAHNVHPLAGQGVNLGLRDARELARVLLGRGAQKDCGDYGLLRRYERARKEDIMALELTTHGLKKLFESRAVSMAALRNVGLSLVDRQALVKNALIRRAVA
jgi:ubiquinone biosynthesis UbiH/UbiF/VisC/COQ6 family hydroxylase